MARVMVVNDIPGMRAVIAYHLKERGDQVVEMINALEAKLLLQDDQNFDAIFSGTAMPFVSGFELLKLVKDRYPFIPVIMMTLDPSDEWHEECHRLKADYCLGAVNDARSVIQALDEVLYKP
jgi:CheY-like chemotaxis protein